MRQDAACSRVARALLFADNERGTWEVL